MHLLVKTFQAGSCWQLLCLRVLLTQTPRHSHFPLDSRFLLKTPAGRQTSVSFSDMCVGCRCRGVAAPGISSSPSLTGQHRASSPTLPGFSCRRLTAHLAVVWKQCTDHLPGQPAPRPQGKADAGCAPRLCSTWDPTACVSLLCVPVQCLGMFPLQDTQVTTSPAVISILLSHAFPVTSVSPNSVSYPRPLFHGTPVYSFHISNVLSTFSEDTAAGLQKLSLCHDGSSWGLPC